MATVTGQELVVRNSGNAPNQPIIVFQGLTDDQFKQALQLFQPRPPTKYSIMSDEVTMDRVASIIAHLEARVYRTKDAKVFFDQAITNHFNNTFATQLPKNVRFHIDEWFHDLRNKHIPEAMRNYDPDGFEPMPEYTGITVDWLAVLIEQELKTPGFIDLLKNCIALEKNIHDKVQKERHQGMTSWGAQRTEMPEALEMPTPMFEYSATNFLTPKH